MTDAIDPAEVRDHDVSIADTPPYGWRCDTCVWVHQGFPSVYDAKSQADEHEESMRHAYNEAHMEWESLPLGWLHALMERYGPPAEAPASEPRFRVDWEGHARWAWNTGQGENRVVVVIRKDAGTMLRVLRPWHVVAAVADGRYVDVALTDVPTADDVLEVCGWAGVLPEPSEVIADLARGALDDPHNADSTVDAQEILDLLGIVRQEDSHGVD